MDETPLTDDQRDHLERRELKRSLERKEAPSPQNLHDEETNRARETFKSDVAPVRPEPGASPSSRKKRQSQANDYNLSREAKIVCPFCQTRGSVQISWSKVKSGGPALWSVFLVPFTYGLSLLFGWQFAEYGRFALCSNCGQGWRME